MQVDNTIKIYEALGVQPVVGDVGIEIECEAAAGSNNFPIPPAPWISTHDGSLRGICIEYVMGSPQVIDTAEKQIKELGEAIKANNTKVKYSIRAGVHVHINVQDMTLQQLLMFAAVYYTLEDVLVEWCGDDRIGNLFCLRARDAEAVIQIAGDAFRRNNIGYFGTDEIRYASLNFCSVPKYGSLEFRAMATEPDFKRIAKWARILHHLKKKSLEFDNIQTILEHFSMSTPTEWVQEVMGEHADLFLDQEDIDQKVWSGIRTAQDLLFHTVR